MSALGYECTPEDIRRIMDEVDEDGSGVIEINEFIQFMTKHMVNFSLFSSTQTICADR